MSPNEFLINAVNLVSQFTIPVIFFGIILLGMLKRVKVYEAFIAGGKEGFDVFLRILPYLVAILVAIGMFRVSGALEYMTDMLLPLTSMIGMPSDCVPVALMKPLSGSGSLGLATEVIKSDPDSFKARVASVIFGSTDTTLYSIALYYGSVNIRKIRHTMLAGLTADFLGIIAAVLICRAIFL